MFTIIYTIKVFEQITNVGGFVEACVAYNIFNLRPLSVGGCLTATASFIIRFNVAVGILIAF